MKNKTIYKFGQNLRYSEYSSKDAGYTVYSVYGEDSNCDMGGSHICPFLGNVEGTFIDVLEYAANNMRFYAWGGGGYIVPLKDLQENVNSIILNEAKKIKLERKEKLQKIDIEFLIQNIDNISKKDIVNYLIEIKNNL